MKKLILCLLALALVFSLLAGCGSKAEQSAAPEAPAAEEPAAEEPAAEEPAAEEPAAEEPAAEEPAAEEPAAEEPAAEESVNPYAWLGLQDMPKCPYLDLLASNKYIQVYDTYVLGIKAEVTEANDGVNSYQKNQSNLSYTVDGMVYSINESAKNYMFYDMSSSLDAAKENMENAIASGTNIRARVFQGTGKEAVPQYSETEGDTNEYEYYEYQIGEPDQGSYMTERFYLRDGDVFAIYSKTYLGETELESTNVIKSISGDIPADTFVVPDLSDYESLN